MTNKLAIVGASGHGKVIADIAEQLGFIVNFYDDAYPSKTHIEHWPIHGTCADLIALNNISTAPNDVVVAIGNNNIRQQKILLLQQNGFNLITLIAPTAVISQYATIAQGSVVFAGAIINAFANIGIGCIVNTSAIIEHDCAIGDFTHICPNTALAGGVIIGSKSWVGIGSQIKQLIVIGENCMIGAGSTVIKNIPDNVTAFGSPAVPNK
ncbi:acetyltransferase [Pseudoalteromonas sp. SWXJZ10B]|uniref:acetyltransferase n=1 Tax=Pseudoalteromonas sp. SWXJZ10B TaxID=2792063 RepID=UPI0018CF5638|nr:acetyltransferase [Pseudoalteromonas sp. SWXJZ10B]MBH0042052.1 acetyltransferase [Pseudoalteromonas sp. SWXJZ10B]